jgi:hypothetical protein
VGLRAVAAVRLEGTLRHFNWLLLNLIGTATVGCSSLSVYPKCDRCSQQNHRERAKPATSYRVALRLNSGTETSLETIKIDLHKEWCNLTFIS